MSADTDALEARIERLEERLEWLEGQSVEDTNLPAEADEDVVRGGLKLRRRVVREELEELRDEQAEATNDEEAADR